MDALQKQVQRHVAVEMRDNIVEKLKASSHHKLASESLVFQTAGYRESSKSQRECVEKIRELL